MSLSTKAVWIVDYGDAAGLQAFHDLAVSVAATDVCIRTSSDLVPAISMFHDSGIRIHGWRWPATVRARTMAEADRAADLFSKGMDGYVVDPEGSTGAPDIDWDAPGLDQLAADFCAAIVAAASGRPFGVTSHYRARAVFPNLPWKAFFQQATVLLPQAYWRTSGGVVGSGDPVKNYETAIADWQLAGGDPSIIVPMAGELPSATDREVDAYVDRAATSPQGAGHFYCHSKTVAPDVWAAIVAA